MEQLPQHSAAAFVAACEANDIAERLRKDTILIRQNQPCSWVALYLPSSDTPEGAKIADCLTPGTNFSAAIKRTLYGTMVSRVKTYLNVVKGIYALPSEVQRAQNRMEEEQKFSMTVSSEEINSALKVLTKLINRGIVSPDLPLKDAVSSLRDLATNKACLTRANSGQGRTPSPNKSNIPQPPTLPRTKLCYICRISLTTPHPSQASMCMPCGAFNMASSRISAPPILTLPATFTALVTGARVNLGYHTALQLLRCGARVLATTRYPGDAVARYAQEHDYASWKSRLRVFGADFRSAADVFALVKNTRQCLSSWTGAERLHLLINNAAQTLTDSVSKEERAIEREVKLLEATGESEVRIRDHYRARVRGGGPLMALGGVEQERGLIQQSNTDLSKDLTTTSDSTVSDTEISTTSSWAQSLFSIPYEDIISAHSVNTFVPLILIRELLPLMGTPLSSTSDQSSPQSSSTKPAAYIINVSSREGIFETHLNSQSKTGHHVHTNMSKAALNMITETEAAGAWRERRVAMNTVDPGYMSAAPECEAGHGGKRPLGWGDGVGRVLWPVAVGEVEGKPVWGRFLKHFGAVEVEPGSGR